MVNAEGQGGYALDTLAQPDQNENRETESLKIFKKRGKAKFFSYPLATALAELRGPLEKSYRSTIYCGCSVVQEEDGTLTSRYCGQRWCVVCSRIRTGRACRAYGPVLEGWADPHFVTLTVPNCSGEELSATMTLMLERFNSCKRAITRTHVLPFVGVRKLECTYNEQRGDYHPHYHVIVDGAEQAERLRALWLRRWKGAAVADAQDVRRCDVDGMMELFKYFSKLVTRTRKGGRTVNVRALDVMFQAMRGRRVWQPFGFQLPKDVEESIEGEKLEVTGSVAFKRQGERVYWDWSQDAADWIDRETGESLSEYEPGERFRAFVESIGTGAGGMAAAVDDG